MMGNDLPSFTIQKRDPVQVMTKVGLVIFFLLGIALIFMGYQAQKEFSSTGFSDESAYQVIYAISRDVSNIWNKQMLPSVNSLPENEQAVLWTETEELLFKYL